MRKSKLIWEGVAFLLVTTYAAAQLPPVTEEPKIHVFASGLFNAQTFGFTDNRSFALYLEEASVNSDWQSATGPAFGLGATYAVVTGLSGGALAVGAALDIVSSTPTESFQALLPHPLFFNQDRTVEGEEASLSYDEKALHFLASYTRSVGRFIVAASGGPSYFWTSTEVIDGFTFSETYPFDEVTLGSVEQESYDANKLGFNIGGWVGYRFLEKLAVGGDLRYTRAKVGFTTSAGNAVEFNAGGFRVGAGIRLLF